ncbi:copper resistance protein CopC [Agromyces sp. MMS24-K17]|uniref:copper resistance CopC family protein n=1 Tax=Agromyces sp. MMS24-K17 TaxID=3372850 RepID=UPI00375462DB
MRRLGVPVLVVAAAFLAVAPAGPASAHNSIVGTSPAADATVTEQPGEVSVTTSDVLIEIGGGNSIDVIGPDGRHYATDCASVDTTVAWAPMALGEAGEYTVEWRVVSADGHPISGEFAFAWAPAEGQELAEGTAEPACADLATGASADAGDAGDSGDGSGGSDSGADAPADAFPVDVLWIGAAAVLVLAAGVVTWLLARRGDEEGGDGDGDGEAGDGEDGTGDRGDGRATAPGTPVDDDRPSASGDGSGGSDPGVGGGR